MKHVTPVPVLAMVAAAAACGGEGTSAPPATEVRDSAGVRIVETRLPGGVAPQYAQLEEPDVRIGVVDGDPAYQLTRVVGAATLPDGSILIAEGSAGQLRVFDADGSHRYTFGGPGGGPGEFGLLASLGGLRGDTVWVWDVRNRRISTFLADGQLVADRTLEADMTVSPRALTRLADGSFLVESMDLPAGPPADVIRTSNVVRRWDVGNQRLDTLAVLPGQVMRPGEPRTMTRPDGTQGTMFMIASPPIPVSAYTAPAEDHVFTGSSEAFRIERRRLSGELDLVLLAPDLERALEASEVESIRRFRLDGCDGDEQCIGTVESSFEQFETPELRPAFSDLKVDALGNLWVAEWEYRQDEISGWHVFSSDGELLGRVPVPAGLDIHEIGADYVLGERENELEVPFVWRHPLTRLR